MLKVRKGFTVIEIAIVVAIVAILAGVWYMSKNKAGADIRMPGIGTTGTTGSGGNTTPPKTGMGTIKGRVTNKDGSPALEAPVYFKGAKCKTGLNNGIVYTALTDKSGYYKIGGIQLGNYCGRATGYYNSWIGGNPAASNSSDVTVKFGETKIVDFVLSQEFKATP